MNPTQRIDLAGVWSFRPENGEKADIQVPGGGWLKQGFNCEAGTYETRIAIPEEGFGRCVYKLELGAVNHWARYSIGLHENELTPIAEDVTAFTPQEVDLTPYVKPGAVYLLRIEVRAFRDGRPVAPHAANWCEAVPRGIFRYARLSEYPAVYISDLFVRTSVEDRAVTCEFQVTNGSDVPASLSVGGFFASWNGGSWPYPSIAPHAVDVEARSSVTYRMNPLPWEAGESSYWRPNLPYREGYLAQLHVAHLALRDGGGRLLHDASARFGFRELRQAGSYYELNGTRINFRGDSLQPANYDRIDHYGKGDAIGTLPGFLPPSAGNPGWPEAVRNFLRLNFNVQRQHMVPWSPYMLDVCDELGLMLIGEGASRLNGFDRTDGRAPYEAKCLQDIVRRDRNHPSIVRWSTVNEPQSADPAYHVELYEAVKAADDTRPVSEDIWSGGYLPENVEEVFRPLLDKPDFTWIEHYLSFDDEGGIVRTSSALNDAVIPLEGRPFGLGEANWDSNASPRSFANFAATIALVRAQDASDVRPYVLLSNWASSIPGVKTTDFIIEGDRFRPLYGEDNLPDPWSHPGIRLLRNACNPLLLFDVEFWRRNRKSNGAGAFPVELPKLKANGRASRRLIVFNDDLEGEELEVRAVLRTGSPSNDPFAEGRMPVAIKPGHKLELELTFVAPPLDCVIFASLQVYKDGLLRFDDETTCFEITDGIVSEWNYARGEDRSIGSLEWRRIEDEN